MVSRRRNAISDHSGWISVDCVYGMDMRTFAENLQRLPDKQMRVSAVSDLYFRPHLCDNLHCHLQYVCTSYLASLLKVLKLDQTLRRTV
jgi:hypothetical protein